MTRPAFASAWNRFVEVYGDGTLTSMGDRIGGKVKQNVDLGKTNPALGFTNGCAIRMSYALGHSGVTIPAGAWATVSGADGRRYIFRVRDLLRFLEASMGKPDKTVRSPKPADFAGERGILVFNVSGWSDASGHATLWDGGRCSDRCYFPNAHEASLWRLK